MINYTDVKLGDIITIRYLVDKGGTCEEFRNNSFKIVCEHPSGWLGLAVKTGWSKVITPETEILKIKGRKHG